MLVEVDWSPSAISAVIELEHQTALALILRCDSAVTTILCIVSIKHSLPPIPMMPNIVLMSRFLHHINNHPRSIFTTPVAHCFHLSNSQMIVTVLKDNRDKSSSNRY